MMEAISYLTIGITLGLAAGISPGPLLALVITRTIRYNKIEGIKIALAPLFTDAPIVVITIFLLSKLTNYNMVLGIISLLGAGFIIYLAFESITVKATQLEVKDGTTSSYTHGIITNILSPHPYLFWILIGAPTTVKAYNLNPLFSVLFIFGFYLLLVGSKVIVAILSEKSKMFLKSKAYLFIIKALGWILVILALFLTWDGVKLLK
jgi:threonine/homoserine/homoserine lactone efflux protein